MSVARLLWRWPVIISVGGCSTCWVWSIPRHSALISVPVLSFTLREFWITNYHYTVMPSVLWRCWLCSRKGIRPEKIEWVLAWLSDCGEVQICIWPSWSYYYSLSVAPGNPDWFGFIFLVTAHQGSPGQNPETCKMIVVVITTTCCRKHGMFHHHSSLLDQAQTWLV